MTEPADPASADMGAIAQRLCAFDAATLHEAQGRRGALDPAIKPVDRSMVVCGPAFTATCVPGDNLMLQLAIDCAPVGSVVVMSNGGDTRTGVFGDMLATAAQSRGLAGLVTDAAVRDAATLRTLGWPVFSAGLCIRGAIKQSTAPLNQPVAIGGQIVEPGDWIFGDEDGVVVIPQREVLAVLDAAHARAEMERGKAAAYRAGRSVIEVNQLGPLLKEKGWQMPPTQPRQALEMQR